MDLDSLEGGIRAIARRYAKNASEIEDLEQLGRVAAWQVCERVSDANRTYVLGAVNFALLNELRKRRAQKRMPDGGFVSLQQPLSSEGNFTIEDTLGEEGFEFGDKELIQTLHYAIRERFGRNYVQKIKTERRPRELVKRIIRGVVDASNLGLEEIPHKVDFKFFRDVGLESLLWVFYRNSPYAAINDAFGGTFLPWEWHRTPKNYWRGKDGYVHALEAVKWFVDVKDLTTPSKCRKISYDDFEKVGLGSMLQVHFNWNSFLALKTAIPELKPWQTKQTSHGYFDDGGNRCDAVTSYLLDRDSLPLSGLTPEETYELGLRLFVSKQDMSDYGLRSLFSRYRGSTYRLFTDIFPDQILPWTLTSVKEPWRENPCEVAADAVRWLFDDYLEMSVDDIPCYATCDLFWMVGFSGILTNRTIGFNSSPFAAVDNAYPGVFSTSDFDRCREIYKLNLPPLIKSRT